VDEMTVGLIADILGILGAIAAAGAWIQTWRLKRRQENEEARLNEKIKIVLQNGAKTIELPVPIRRGDLTRAELLGRIGMIRPSKRFQLESLNTQQFFDDLDAVTSGSGEETLKISLTDKDYNQFIE